MGRKQNRIGEWVYFLGVCLLAASLLICGCGHYYEGLQAKSTFEEANDLFSRANYVAALDAYERILEQYPTTADRVLFEMGIIYAYPGNEHKDYEKSLECFKRIVKEHPGSMYRLDSDMMIFYINNITLKDKRIAMQYAQIETLQQEVKSKEDEIIALQNRIDTLEQNPFKIRNATADKILIEKKERRLTLLSKGKVLKSYKIALGGNPNGPKERQGDKKTPEGTYIIDSRNRNSRYYLSMRISYPNEKDKQRAKELGVSPGGDIMIHGLRNGFSSVAGHHTQFDWTKGCIAVTDEEIEEIEKLTPNGTLVEIRP